MTASEQIVRTVVDAPWPPPGGRADVVRTEGGSGAEPTSLVRLLVERDDAVFCVPRDFVVIRTGTTDVGVPGTWAPLAAPGDLVERHGWPLVG
jgi:hypothetical protein